MGYLKKILLILCLGLISFPAFAKSEDKEFVPANFPTKYDREYINKITPQYKSVGKEEVFYVALDMLRNTTGEFSRLAILGNNLTDKPVKIEFRDLGEINKDYESFDALGWKKGKRLYIFINPRHKDAPPGALAALLSHIRRFVDPETLFEFTLEAGRPDTITAEKLAVAKENGVSRVSVNPQTLEENVLRVIGRRHTVDDFFRAYELAEASGIRDINIDLIAGLPGDNFHGFSSTIDRILHQRLADVL